MCKYSLIVALLTCSCGTSGAEPSPSGGAGAGVAASGAPATAGANFSPPPGGGNSGGSGGMSGAPAASAGTARGGAPSAGAPSAGAGVSAGPGGTGGAAAGAPNPGGAPSGGAPQGGTSMMAGASQGGIPTAPADTSLREKYEDHYPIGAAVDSQSYMTHAALLTKHFNSITAENEMKFESLQPTEGNFTYAAADRIVDFAMRNGMKVRGHALVWHTQNPSWLFTSGGGTASKAVLLDRMRNHITAVMNHFKGKVYAWDVVNEAIMDDGSFRDQNQPEGRNSRWYEIAGEDYIKEAFIAAAAADPTAKLFYNDFYNYIPAKRQAIHEMLKGLLDAGVKVDGVGLQAHINIEPSKDPMNQAYHQTVENMEAAIELYASLGLEVHITEMDLSLYVPGITYTEETFYTAATFTQALKLEQAERYRAFLDMFRRHKDEITSLTFWGVADDNTWLSEFSSGRKDFPLLFDDDHRPKRAFDAAVAF